MTTNIHEDVPPPPYTETDIYSVSGGAQSLSPEALSSVNLSANSLPSDDVASAISAARSTASLASSNGDVVYTPPLTPRSAHQSNFASEADHLASSSAATYFETRPTASFHAGEQLIYSIAVHSSSSPEDFPYPTEWASRDVRLEDWQTFVNYLIPHYSAVANSQVIDRKLHDEGITNDEASRSRSRGRTHAEAQLDQIRFLTEGAPAQRQNIEDTVREWNDGFFVPRGITITLNPPSHADDPLPVPGAWDRSFDQQAAGAAGADSGNTTRGSRCEAGRTRFGSFNPFRGGAGCRGTGSSNNNSRAFTFAGITVGNEGISWGNSVVADRNGVRIGGLVADNSGISLDGTPLFPGGHGGRHRYGHHNRGGVSGPWSGPWSSCVTGSPFGPRPESLPPPVTGLGHQRGGGPEVTNNDGSCGGGWGTRGRGRGRLRRPSDGHGHGQRSRSSSASSISSLSSSSSSSSLSSTASSIGSLPSYDELVDSQLPLTKELLQKWINHPNQHIAKESIKQMRTQIQEAARQGCSTTTTTATFNQATLSSLRRDVKALMQEWKKVMKAQKKLQKQARKRERKAAKRTAKKERKNAKRQVKAAKRKLKREARERGRGTAAAAAATPPPPPPQCPPSPTNLWGHHLHQSVPPTVMPFAIPTPHISTPHMSTPHISTPHISPPHISPPHISPPHIRPPHIPPSHISPPNMPGIPPVFTSSRPPPGHTHSPDPPPGFFGQRGFFNFNFRGGPGPGCDNDGQAPAPAPAPPFFPPPGSWPAASADDTEDETSVHHHHAVSRAKYRAAEDLERELVAKEAELFALHEEILRRDDEKEEERRGREEKKEKVRVKDKDGSGRGGSAASGIAKQQESADENADASAELDAQRLETEITALARNVERLRIEADAEFAREIAQLEMG